MSLADTLRRDKAQDSIGISNVRNFVRERLMQARHRYYRLVEDDHAHAYRRLMRYRVRHHGAEHAVGHYEEDMGMFQFERLLDVAGISPSDRVLDLGCGTMRLGRYLIPYLNAGNYIGLDVSPEALETGQARLWGDVVARKRPTLECNDDLRLDELSEPVDVVWAQSLVSHLPEDDVRELFEALPGALADGGVAYLTFFPEPQSSAKDYGYLPEHMAAMAEDAGLEFELVAESVLEHPKGQRFARLEVADA